MNFTNFVYIIKGINNKNRIKYYIGYTNNLLRRIKQHNRLLSGGAKKTIGYKWEYCCIFANVKNRIEGLKVEWRIQHSTKKRNIINKLISFFNYKKKYNIYTNLILYLNKNLLPKNNINFLKNIISVNINLDNIIINHIINI